MSSITITPNIYSSIQTLCNTSQNSGPYSIPPEVAVRAFFPKLEETMNFPEKQRPLLVTYVAGGYIYRAVVSLTVRPASEKTTGRGDFCHRGRISGGGRACGCHGTRWGTGMVGDGWEDRGLF